MAEEERYEIQGKIAQGGLGSIYRAHDRQLNRTVAIKRIHPDPDADPEEALQSIFKESRALSALSSTHIVSVFDIDQDEDGPYVVMEYLEGETLENLVNRAPLVEGDFIAAAEQTLEGLIAAHEQNIIHRDIKPSNLMFTWLPSGRFQLKILDFGLAKFSQEPAVQTMAHGGSLMGSIYFMAPEQFSRQPLDGRTDLYALGCVLYYSITGNNPFEGENATEVMAGHIQGNFPPLLDIRPDINPALLAWVEKLMALEPDNRFASAQEAFEALNEIKLAPRPETITGPILATAVAPDTRPVLSTGPIPTATLATPADSLAPSGPQHPLTVTLPTTGVPVWLLITVGVLAAGILILSVIALTSGRLDPPEETPATAPSEEVTEPTKEKTAAPEQAPPADKPANKPKAKQTRPGKSARAAYQRVVKKHDSNGDNLLTLDEFSHPSTAEVQARYAERLAALDRNGDSILSFPELYNPETAKRFRAFLMTIDTDQSGDLQISEFEDYLAGRGGHAADQRFREMDLDQDGTVYVEELVYGRLLHWVWGSLPL